MNSMQIRTQFRIVMLCLAVAFTGMVLSTPAAAQSVPGEPCRECRPVKPNPGQIIPDATPKPKPRPRPVVCKPFRIFHIRLLLCPDVGLVWGN